MEDGKTPLFFHLPFSIRHWPDFFNGLPTAHPLPLAATSGVARPRRSRCRDRHLRPNYASWRTPSLAHNRKVGLPGPWHARHRNCRRTPPPCAPYLKVGPTFDKCKGWTRRCRANTVSCAPTRSQCRTRLLRPNYEVLRHAFTCAQPESRPTSDDGTLQPEAAGGVLHPPGPGLSDATRRSRPGEGDLRRPRGDRRGAEGSVRIIARRGSRSRIRASPAHPT